MISDVDLTRAVTRFLTAVTERQMEGASVSQLADGLRVLADRLDRIEADSCPDR